jgi:hypothetical protein
VTTGVARTDLSAFATKESAMSSIRQHLFAILALALVICVRPDDAVAQGTGGTIPEPMGLRDASELIGRRISLTGADRRAIEEAHDRYLEAFARFRDTEVQDYLDTLQQVQASSSTSRSGIFSRRPRRSWRAMRRCAATRA